MVYCGSVLFASNIGSEHIVGLAGNGATSGMAMAHYELHAWIMVILAWYLLPFTTKWQSLRCLSFSSAVSIIAQDGHFLLSA